MTRTFLELTFERTPFGSFEFLVGAGSGICQGSVRDWSGIGQWTSDKNQSALDDKQTEHAVVGNTVADTDARRLAQNFQVLGEHMGSVGNDASRRPLGHWDERAGCQAEIDLWKTSTEMMQNEVDGLIQSVGLCQSEHHSGKPVR